jgi:hypothetical protein
VLVLLLALGSWLELEPGGEQVGLGASGLGRLSRLEGCLLLSMCQGSGLQANMHGCAQLYLSTIIC